MNREYICTQIIDRLTGQDKTSSSYNSIFKVRCSYQGLKSVREEENYNRM